MDPFSTLASVAALVEAVHKLSKLLGKAIGVKNAPDVLLALNNEISDLYLVLDDVNDLLLASTRSFPPKSLRSALERVKSTVLQLEKFIAYELTTFDSAGRARVDKSAFLRKEKRLQRLKDDVRANRAALGAALSLFASLISMHGDCQLRQTYCSIEMLHDRLNNLSVDQESRPVAHCHDSEPAVLREAHDEYKSDPPTTIQVFKTACDAGCLCTCHHYNRIKSPAFLSNILGTLFIGYRANMSLRQTCTDVACRAHASGVVCTYTFPLWLMKYAISISHSSFPSKGPELLLRLMRVRDFAPIMQILLSNSKSWLMDEMKRMLDTGLASVLDVDDDGWSILYYAILRREWPLARLLISYGADVNYETNDSLSPFIGAWTARFRSENIPRDILEDWDKLFLRDRSQMDVFGFSNLHRAYLGLSGLSFWQVLELTDRSCIDDADSVGRTLLHWAAIRGSSDTVAQLLAMGAEPSKQDKTGFTPLHYAVQSDSTTSKILLDAKADPKILSFAGYTPLHSIGQNSTCLIKRLVELGSDINKIGEKDITALHTACYCGQPRVVHELLACGADVNICDRNGRSQVMTAIKHNWHQILSTLISAPSFDASLADSNGWDISVYAAAYGDVQTLKILSDEWPAGNDFGRRGQRGQAWEFAQYRRYNNEQWSRTVSRPPDPDPVAWFDAFENMIKGSVKRQAGEHEPDDLAYRDDVWEDAREFFSDP